MARRRKRKRKKESPFGGDIKATRGKTDRKGTNMENSMDIIKSLISEEAQELIKELSAGMLGNGGTVPDSTAIRDYAYCLGKHVLAIRFTTSDNIYVYGNVPETVWWDFVESDSLGAYFNSEIRNKYDFVKLAA